MTQNKNTKNIVVIGGGKGIAQVLLGLKDEDYHLSAIVSMADDGGSSGILRKELDMLPPGDVRRALIALAQNELLAQIFDYRFSKGKGLKGHNLGNLIIAALAQMTDFGKAIESAKKLLNVKGNVIPITLKKTALFGKLENGQTIKGEHNIDVPAHDGKLKITNIWLEPRADINPRAKIAIGQADMIILGPGDLFTSIIPNLLVDGVKEAINKSSAIKVFFCNLKRKFGETTNFTATDFLAEIELYLGKNVLNFFIVDKNSEVIVKKENFKKLNLIYANLSNNGQTHESKKISRVIRSIWHSKY